MNKPFNFNDELLSAYLDGELTADEQALVERALADDAQLRQLHDDLRALRQSLQSMPRLKLGDDFTARVVRQAQKALENELCSEGDIHVKSSAPPLTQHSKTELSNSNNKPTGHAAHPHVVAVAPHEPVAWRVMAWSVAALAATIMVAMVWPQPLGRIAE